MHNVVRRRRSVFCLTGLLAASCLVGARGLAAPQEEEAASALQKSEEGPPKRNPTVSLEVAAVNDLAVQGGHISHVVAQPGDVLTVEIYLRDWSPDGERLRAYQFTLDERGYSSGYEGTIQPVDFESTTAQNKPNKKNCFVDPAHPDYVFAGLQNFGITDSVSTGYRWLGALVDTDQCRLCPQDGTKYYCGTVKMAVSDQARGPFTLRLVEAVWASSLRNPKNQALLGLDFEPLTVNVVERTLRVLSSDPPSGAIDARLARATADTPHGGISRILLRCNAQTAALTPPDFTIEDGTDHPPHIQNVSSTGPMVTLELDRGITRGAWTTVTHKDSGTGTRIGYLPGDVSNDGAADTQDIEALIALVAPAPLSDASPLYRYDVDHDGTLGVGDLLRLIDLLAKPDAYRARLRDLK